MKNVSYKYKQLFGRLFLTAYLLLNVVNIVHYHRYDFQYGNPSYNYASENINHSANFSFDNTFCLIHYFVLSSQNISNNEIKYSFDFEQTKLLLHDTSGIIINSEYLSLNLLRAPPTLI
jgi:hypothetical protein